MTKRTPSRTVKSEQSKVQAVPTAAQQDTAPSKTEVAAGARAASVMEALAEKLPALQREAELELFFQGLRSWHLSGEPVVPPAWLREAPLPSGRAWLLARGCPFWANRLVAKVADDAQPPAGVISSANPELLPATGSVAFKQLIADEWSIAALLGSPEVQAVREAHVLGLQIARIGGLPAAQSVVELAGQVELQRKWRALSEEADALLSVFWDDDGEALSDSALRVHTLKGLEAMKKRSAIIPLIEKAVREVPRATTAAVMAKLQEWAGSPKPPGVLTGKIHNGGDVEWRGTNGHRRQSLDSLAHTLGDAVKRSQGRQSPMPKKN